MVLGHYTALHCTYTHTFHGFKVSKVTEQQEDDFFTIRGLQMRFSKWNYTKHDLT